MKFTTIMLLTILFTSCASEKYVHKRPKSSQDKDVTYSGNNQKLWERHFLRFDRK